MDHLLSVANFITSFEMYILVYYYELKLSMPKRSDCSIDTLHSVNCCWQISLNISSSLLIKLVSLMIKYYYLKSKLNFRTDSDFVYLFKFICIRNIWYIETYCDFTETNNESIISEMLFLAVFIFLIFKTHVKTFLKNFFSGRKHILK